MIQAEVFRSQLLAQIDPTVQPLPSRPSVGFVWPTEFCTVGCAHCNFPLTSSRRSRSRLLANHGEEVSHWLSQARARAIVVCGGGEPLDEPEFVLASLVWAARLGLTWGIYTSGVSLKRPRAAADSLREWDAAWQDEADGSSHPTIRLSVDAFHEERVGLEPVIEWIREAQRAVCHWHLSLRALRVQGDDSLHRLASALGASTHFVSRDCGHLVLPSGRRIPFERKAFVFDGLGRAALLTHRGMRLDESDSEAVRALLSLFGDEGVLGRPLSTRLTVSHRELDLEIHADGIAHILESSASDMRLSILRCSWEQVRDQYFRDPILHLVAAEGLPGVAELILAARKVGIAPPDAVPYSVEHLTEPGTLAFVTAAALLRTRGAFKYEPSAIQAAQEYLLDVAGPALLQL